MDPKEINVEVNKEEDLVKENEHLKIKTKHARRFALVFGCLALLFMGVVVGIFINLSIENDKSDHDKICGELPLEELLTRRNLLGEPKKPGLFNDLTSREIQDLRAFLEADVDVNLTKPENGELNQARLYMMDLEPPPKAEALAYLDGNGTKPDRQARVILFRGDLDPPVVEERVCGPFPLSNVSSCVVQLTTPFSERPVELNEYDLWYRKVIPDIQKEFGQILSESYGGSFDDACTDNCFNFWFTPVGTNVYGQTGRKIWFWPVYDVEYMSAHPVDFAVLCNVDGIDPEKFSIEKVWYAGALYNSPKALKDAYAADSIQKTRVTYPKNDNKLYSSIHLRGDAKPKRQLRPPQLIEPDGRRYTVRHCDVTYLDMWSFCLRMSPISGPRIYDIRFLGERIVYELSLGEIVGFHSANEAPRRQLFEIMSAFLIGVHSKALVPGTDCPLTATYVPATFAAQHKQKPAVFNRAMCIFEQSTGAPLRRHHSYSVDEGAFYAGMMDSHLVVRSIHVVDNYDYILDFTFHQSGAIGVSLSLTGYTVAGFWSTAERPYGFRIQNNLLGPLYYHAASFKVDMDIGGTSNRYETLEVSEETVTLRETSPGRQFSQIRMDPKLKTTEKQAAYAFDPNTPTEHIFYNENKPNTYGEKKAFRIVNNAMSKHLIKEDVGNEAAATWARYQLAVTRHKDTEVRSGTMYEQWDTVNTGSTFQQFLDDDQSIVDEDLVAWVTLASHSVPHSEDLPVTATTGKVQQFFIMPFNYYTEDPSMASRDAVRIAHKSADRPEEGLAFDFYGTGDVMDKDTKKECEYKPWDPVATWRNRPDDLVETNRHKGVLR